MGSWVVPVKLRRIGPSVTHIPASGYIGRDRLLAFYLGQPKLCYKCNSPLHFSANCTEVRCSRCNEVGHTAEGCTRIQCNLCGVMGHPFSRCPAAFRAPEMGGSGSGGPAGPVPLAGVVIPPRQAVGQAAQCPNFVIGSGDPGPSTSKGLVQRPKNFPPKSGRLAKKKAKNPPLAPEELNPEASEGAQLAPGVPLEAAVPRAQGHGTSSVKGKAQGGPNRTKSGEST